MSAIEVFTTLRYINVHLLTYFCKSNYVYLYAVQLLDAVMNLIEPAGRFHRSEVCLLFNLCSFYLLCNSSVYLCVETYFVT